MARRLLLVTYTPHRATDREAYERWIRERDYPAFRQSPRIDEYSCFRVVQSVQGEEWFSHLDLILVGEGVDFLRDLRQGDQFRVVYEVRSHDGRYAGAGRVLALEFINGGKTYSGGLSSVSPRGCSWRLGGRGDCAAMSFHG